MLTSDAALIMPSCPFGSPPPACTPSVPWFSEACSAPVTDTSPLGGAGTFAVSALSPAVAGQPAPYDREGLAAVRTQQVEDVEALPVTVLALQGAAGYEQLVAGVVVPAGAGLAAGGDLVDGQQAA